MSDGDMAVGSGGGAAPVQGGDRAGDAAADEPGGADGGVRGEPRAGGAGGHADGGHFVQGHVDTTAEIVGIAADGNAVTLRFRVRDDDDGAQQQQRRAAVMRYIVHKGFVALDGTSLTVTRVDDAAGCWEVMLIAYTQEKVVLARKKVGDSVNVEVDVLAKYAEKSLAAYLGASGGQALIQPIVERMVQEMVAQASKSSSFLFYFECLLF